MISKFWRADAKNPLLFSASNDLKRICRESAQTMDEILQAGGFFAFSLSQGFGMWVLLDQIFLDEDEALTYLKLHESKVTTHVLTGYSYVSFSSVKT